MQDVLDFALSLAQSCLRHPPLRAHAAVLAATTASAATAVRLAVPLQAMKGLMEHINNDAGGEVSFPSQERSTHSVCSHPSAPPAYPAWSRLSHPALPRTLRLIASVQAG